MDRNAFWKIIDEARQSVGDTDELEEVASAVTDRLKALSPQEIVSFEQHLSDLMAESYRWDLWGVAYLVNGGCSDDGFDYFRGWLLANGRERWEMAMANPELAGEWTEPDAAFCEDMLYVAMDAYEAATGKELPQETLTIRRPDAPLGERWEEDQLEELYPDLYEKFS